LLTYNSLSVYQILLIHVILLCCVLNNTSRGSQFGNLFLRIVPRFYGCRRGAKTARRSWSDKLYF